MLRQTNANVVDEARRWVGTPWVHQARGPMGRAGGVDCVGLLVCVARGLGLDVDDFTAYSLTPRAEDLLEYMARSCARVSSPDEPSKLLADGGAQDHATAGRVALFWFSSPAHPQHAGILSGPRSMIHTHSGTSLREVRDMPILKAYADRMHSVWEYRWQR